MPADVTDLILYKGVLYAKFLWFGVLYTNSVLVLFGAPSYNNAKWLLDAGGDNSDRAMGIFYEGVLTAGYALGSRFCTKNGISEGTGRASLP